MEYNARTVVKPNLFTEQAKYRTECEKLYLEEKAAATLTRLRNSSGRRATSFSEEIGSVFGGMLPLDNRRLDKETVQTEIENQGLLDLAVQFSSSLQPY